MIIASRKPLTTEDPDADVQDLLALASALLTTLNNMEHRMMQLQADYRLFRYVRVAHALSTCLQGRLLDVQGQVTLVQLAAEETNR